GGGARVASLLPRVRGYTLGRALLRVGSQAGGALPVAGIATLLPNAPPIAAGAVIRDEPVPGGALGGLRVLAFAAVIIGAVLLARPQKPAEARAAARQRDAA